MTDLVSMTARSERLQLAGLEHDALMGSCAQPAWHCLLLLLVAVITGLMLNAQALLNWLNVFPVHPLVEWAISMADQWLTLCEDIGLTRPFDAVRNFVQLMKEYGQ